MVAGVAAVVLLVASLSSSNGGTPATAPGATSGDAVRNPGLANPGLAEQNLAEQKLAEQKLAEQNLAEQKLAEQGVPGGQPPNPALADPASALPAQQGGSLQVAEGDAPSQSPEGSVSSSTSSVANATGTDATEVDAPPGTLNVNSEPSSELFINGRSRGHTPLTGLRLPPGEYQLVLVEPGHNRRIKTVRIQSRQLTAVNVKFGDLSQAIGASSSAPASSQSAPAAAVTAPTRNCTPRFFIDADGVRRVKPECLF